jgi:hypothetical protein
MEYLKEGQIIMWSSSTIPSGWYLCDGTNGTPDLRGKFIYGASADGDVGSTGGVSTHSHTGGTSSSNGSHGHTGGTVSVGASSGTATMYSGGSYYAAASNTSHTHSGGTPSIGSLNSTSNAHTHTISATSGNSTSDPPYIKLYYIMKVSDE